MIFIAYLIFLGWLYKSGLYDKTDDFECVLSLFAVGLSLFEFVLWLTLIK